MSSFRKYFGTSTRSHIENPNELSDSSFKSKNKLYNLTQAPTSDHYSSSSTLQQVNDIILMHYPNYRSSQIPPSSFQELLNCFIQDIKGQNRKNTDILENRILEFEKNKEVLRIEKEHEVEKNDYLRKQMDELRTKIKKNEQKVYEKNEQIFQRKQEVERIEKQKIMRESKIREINSEFEEFRQSAYTQIQKFKQKIRNLIAENKHLKKEIKFMNGKVDDYSESLTEYDKEIQKLKRKCDQLEEQKNTCEIMIQKLREKLRQNQNELGINSNIKFSSPNLHAQGNNGWNLTIPPASSTRYEKGVLSPQSKQYPHTLLNGSFEALRRNHSGVGVRPRVRSVNSRVNLSMNRSNQPLDSPEMLRQVQQLRRNQSNLLDKIIQKDKIIEQLQSMVEENCQNLEDSYAKQDMELFPDDRNHKILIQEEDEVSMQ